MTRSPWSRAARGDAGAGAVVPPAHLALGALLAVALAHLLVEVALNGFHAYGYFNDEFYYIACSKRLGLGFVDHPPLAPLLLRGVRAILGDSLPAIRLPAAVAGAATVFLTGRMAFRLGGGKFAQTLAALAVAVAPGLLVLFGFFSTNPFEILVWTASADLVLALAAGADPRWWLVLGGIAGLGLENKHTTAVFVAALAIAVLASPLRERLREPWPWLGLLVAFLLFLPNLVWEVRHDWISLQFYRAAETVKNVPTSSLRAALDQVLFMNPVTMPLWLLGLRFYLLDREGRPWRVLGWTFGMLFALTLLVPTSRPDRIAGAYPMLFAAGAVVFERWGRRPARVAVVAACAVSVAVFAPLTLPLIPPHALATYARVLHLNPQVELQRHNALPQWAADSLGWEDLADAVAAVARTLPPEGRDQAAVLAGDYAYAGSLEFFGPARGVPRVISAHNQYFLWGPGGPPPRVVIALGTSRTDLERLFTDVEQAATFRCEFCYQDGMPIWVATRPRVSLRDAWPGLEHFE